MIFTSLSCNNSNEGPRETKSVTEKLLKSRQPLHGLPGMTHGTTNSVPGSEKSGVRALRKTGLRIQEVAGATPILYNDLQIPVRLKSDLKHDKEDTNASSSQHLDMPQSPSSGDIDDSTRVLKNSTSEPSLSMMPLRPSDKPCPLSMAPRRKTEQRSLKSQNRYARPESGRLFTMLM